MKLSEDIFVYGMNQRPVATSAIGPPSPYKEWKAKAEQLEEELKEVRRCQAIYLVKRSHNEG